MNPEIATVITSVAAGLLMARLMLAKADWLHDMMVLTMEVDTAGLTTNKRKPRNARTK